jgi:hypothetical protein
MREKKNNTLVTNNQITIVRNFFGFHFHKKVITCSHKYLSYAAAAAAAVAVASVMLLLCR